MARLEVEHVMAWRYNTLLRYGEEGKWDDVPLNKWKGEEEERDINF